MKKISISIMLIMMILNGCTDNSDKNVEANTITVFSENTIFPTATASRESNDMLEPIASTIFSRIDDNPAEFAIHLGKPFIAKTITYGRIEKTTIYDAYPIYYVDKGYLNHKLVYIRCINLYGEKSPFRSYGILRDIEGNHIFVSEYTYTYCSVAEYRDDDIVYSLKCVSEKPESIQNEDGSYSSKSSNLLNDGEITNIKRFLEVKDNKIYYQSIADEVYTLEMTTYEINKVEEYKVIDYTSLPDNVADYTKEYILIYDESVRGLSLKSSNIVNGQFTMGEVEQTINIPDYGEIIDIKASDNQIFIVFKSPDSKYRLFTYFMLDNTYEELFSSDKAFDASLATDNDYFAAFYGGENDIEAIKYNFDRNDIRLIYDSVTEMDGWHVAVGETDDYVEEHRYADINYMVYKGNILFGFNIDDKGVTTLVFKTDVVDRESLPRP